MTFWSQTSVEPKRSFRWLLYLSGMPQFIVTKVKKPGFSVGSTPHNFLNYEFKYPGRVTWAPINFTVVDPVTPDSTASLYAILENAGYKLPTDYNEATAQTISKSGMVQALGTQIKLVQLDAVGNPLETWTVNNPQITSIDFGDLDYGNDGMVNITVNLNYDWATLETHTPGDQKWNLEVPTENRSSKFTGDNRGSTGFG